MHFQNFMSFINCLNAGDCCSRKCTCQGSLPKAESEAIILRFRQQEDKRLRRALENEDSKGCRCVLSKCVKLHFDTAANYGSEAPLGKAIAQALQQGLVKTRDELFITSKLWPTDAHHDRVLPALKQTLQNLELDYIDLYLIHQPLSLKPGEIKFPFDKEDLLPMDFKAVWEAMEECQRLGLVKSIGVSNFSWKKLSQLMVNAKIPPAVNQVELNPAWQQKKLRDFCKENGILVSAWSPLGAFGASWGSLAVMDSPILKEIAAARGKSTAQVSLRWIYQQGVSVIVKSYNKERMKENLGIFDWELSEEELQQISQIPQHRGFSGEFFISPTGPYKTVQELWDEDS